MDDRNTTSNRNKMRGGNGIRDLVKETALGIYEQGLAAGTSGNVSFFDREAGIIYITPSNVEYSSMKPEDIVAITIEGDMVEGHLKPSSEWRLHTALYRSFGHVNSVIHTHSPYATSLAAAGIEVPLILVEMIPFLGGSVPVAEFGMPGTDEVGRNTAEAMKGRNAALLKNHGVVAVGNSLKQAYLRAVYTEDAAKIYHMALQAGTPAVLSRSIEEQLRRKYRLPVEPERERGGSYGG